MNSELVRGFADTRSVAPSTYHMRRDDSEVVVFCFAKPDDAEVFRERFGGERVWARGACGFRRASHRKRKERPDGQRMLECTWRGLLAI